MPSDPDPKLKVGRLKKSLGSPLPAVSGGVSWFVGRVWVEGDVVRCVSLEKNDLVIGTEKVWNGKNPVIVIVFLGKSSRSFTNLRTYGVCVVGSILVAIVS